MVVVAAKYRRKSSVSLLPPFLQVFYELEPLGEGLRCFYSTHIFKTKTQRFCSTGVARSETKCPRFLKTAWIRHHRSCTVECKCVIHTRIPLLGMKWNEMERTYGLKHNSWRTWPKHCLLRAC